MTSNSSQVFYWKYLAALQNLIITCLSSGKLTRRSTIFIVLDSVKFKTRLQGVQENGKGVAIFNIVLNIKHVYIFLKMASHFCPILLTSIGYGPVRRNTRMD